MTAVTRIPVANPIPGIPPIQTIRAETDPNAAHNGTETISRIEASLVFRLSLLMSLV
jgi:hypothetical protein